MDSLPGVFRLDGKVALLTGAGRGIGLAIAGALARAGCAVAIQDLDVAVAEAEARRIAGETGVRTVALGGDVSDLETARRLIPETLAALGGLHVLVNNAAIQQTSESFGIVPAEQVEREWRANFVTPMLLCQQAIEQFRPQQWGRILNLGSIQGRGGNAHMPGYSATKAAIENLTRSLARDTGRDGIRVNCLAPGWFDTMRNADDLAQPGRREQGPRWIPVPRLGKPEDCAAVALLLCSDAADYITGQTIYVDGGMSAR